MASVWTGRTSEARGALWLDGEVVWDSEPGGREARQVARIAHDHIWQLDALGRDGELLGFIPRGGKVDGPDRRTAVGYVQRGEAYVPRGLGRDVVGITDPPDDRLAAAGLLLSFATQPEEPEASLDVVLTGVASMLVAKAWQERGQRRFMERYGGRYEAMERLQSSGEADEAVAAARALRQDLLADRKARRSAGDMVALLAAGAALVELSNTSRIDFALAAETERTLGTIGDPALANEVLKLRTHLSVRTGRLDDALATATQLAKAEPGNKVYRDMVAQLTEAVTRRDEAAKAQSKELLAAARDGVARAQANADRLSALVSTAQELEAEFAAMFGGGEKFTFSKVELPARLEAADALHVRVRALLDDIVELRGDPPGTGLLGAATGRLHAPVEALELTLARITRTLRDALP